MEEMVFGRRYRVTEKIGTGGMAEVYKAVDEVLGRTVAVKVMHARYAGDPNFAARFRQEAQAVANLQSPYIVNIYDWGQDGSTYYIAMEYVRGADLKSIIQQRGALDSQRVAEIGAQVAAALSVAHGYDVIHRDVKPHNIMLTADGAVKVMDFGIARAGNTTMTQTGSVLGTAHYVSPEQAQGRPLTAASDLYSLGVVLYEAATGQLPFDAETPVAVALKQVNEQPRRPSELNPRIDAGFEAVILKAMAKQPSERYETADELRRDLLKLANGQQVQATSVVPAVSAVPGPPDRTSVMPAATGAAAPAVRPVPRRRPVWPWILLAALLIAAGIGAAAWLGLLGTPGVPVPDVVGLQLVDAEKSLTDAGFQVGEVSEEFDAEKPAGEVLDQSPPANAKAAKSTPVNLTVSKGPELVEVPEIVGLSREDARTAITAAGLVPDPQPDEFSSKYEEGTVFKQDPKSGEQLSRGDSVSFVVSRGKKTVMVPDVGDRSRSSAVSALEDAGLKARVVTQFDEEVPEGRVISQNPLPGIEVVEGSTVTIVVSKGSELVEVPDVIGATADQARATIEGAGLTMEIEYEPHAENGLVLDQNPKSPTKIKRGSTVTVVVDAVQP